MTDTNKKTLAIINSHAPFGTNTGKDALDIALIFGSYEQSTSLFFQGDGVWQLTENQKPEKINNKDYLKTFSAFEFYDLEHIYVCEKSLKQRQLSANFHIKNVQTLDSKTFAQKLSEHKVILRF